MGSMLGPEYYYEDSVIAESCVLRTLKGFKLLKLHNTQETFFL
jgi:hypothetical protein